MDIRAAGFFAVAIASVATACTSAGSGGPDTSYLNAPSPCKTAGGTCVDNNSYHGGAATCADLVARFCLEGALCCGPTAVPVLEQCSGRPCSQGDGNTCDSTVYEYCTGQNNTPNCGAFTCLNSCTCAGDAGCACPACQVATTSHQAYCDAGETDYECLPVGSGPPQTGTCRALSTGVDYCCTP